MGAILKLWLNHLKWFKKVILDATWLNLDCPHFAAEGRKYTTMCHCFSFRCFMKVERLCDFWFLILTS